MTDNITANISGLKCDTPSCDYRDDSITLEQYESCIDMPCPNCGASLLTQEDYDQVQKIVGVMNFVNTLPKAKADNPNDTCTVAFEMNGTGNVDINIKENKKEK